MRYYELNEEDKKKYGPILLDLIEERIKKNLRGRINLNDYLLITVNDDLKGWIYYPDID